MQLERKKQMKTHRLSIRVLSMLLLLVLADTLGPAHARASAFFIDISGPPNSGSFGQSVTLLPNGNFVVTDPNYPSYTNYTEARGAVYHYNPNGVLISTLRGSQIGNSVGNRGITVLASGDYVVISPFWDSPTTDGVGAITWCSQVTGCNGFVSTSNSLVGSRNGDLIGSGGVTALANGNYVVGSPDWQAPGYNFKAGALTWGNGAGGTTGVVSAANSLVGATENDRVGSKVMALANGNYLVLASGWDNAGVVDAGMVAWGNGMGGSAGVISAANSLVGTMAGDNVGDDFWGRVIELTNGNYVVVSPEWDLDAAHQNAGAVTWGSGTSGLAGPISASNSLVGNSDNILAEMNVTVLTNGNYVVASPYWSPDGTDAHWGAATWGSGTVGVSGQVAASNSLVGSRSGDYVGYEVLALTNGNYVVVSSDWALDETHSYVGAVTWGNGTSGTTGPVSSSNSLIGRALMSAGGGGVIALANGNYAISSPTWSPGSPAPNNIGAVTWGNGAGGTVGPISTSNSLVGINTYDSVGDGGLVALTNGNFVAISTGNWSGVPGVTWVNGSHMTTGVISAANSLVGSTAEDEVGNGMYGGGVKALTNGNYVVISPYWDNGAITDVGAITWGDGAHGTTGVVSQTNSLVGTTADDRLGGDWWHGEVTILTNGNYVVSAPQWDNGSVVDAGAVTWGNGAGGTVGPVSAYNSLVGSSTGDMGVVGPFGGDFEVVALGTGNYIVNSPQWNHAGSLTWGDGTSGTAGALSASNSLVNTCVGFSGSCQSKVTALPDGNAIVQFPKWSSGSRNGAVSLVAGPPAIPVGPLGADNSVLANVGGGMVSAYDASRAQLIVGRPGDNKVTILRLHAGPTRSLYLPVVIK
jgi:hypothetical protein